MIFWAYNLLLLTNSTSFFRLVGSLKMWIFNRNQILRNFSRGHLWNVSDEHLSYRPMVINFDLFYNLLLTVWLSLRWHNSWHKYCHFGDFSIGSALQDAGIGSRPSIKGIRGAEASLLQKIPRWWKWGWGNSMGRPSTRWNLVDRKWVEEYVTVTRLILKGNLLQNCNKIPDFSILEATWNYLMQLDQEFSYQPSTSQIENCR